MCSRTEQLTSNYNRYAEAIGVAIRHTALRPEANGTECDHQTPKNQFSEEALSLYAFFDLPAVGDIALLGTLFVHLGIGHFDFFEVQTKAFVWLVLAST